MSEREQATTEADDALAAVTALGDALAQLATLTAPASEPSHMRLISLGAPDTVRVHFPRRERDALADQLREQRARATGQANDAYLRPRPDDRAIDTAHNELRIAEQLLGQLENAPRASRLVVELVGSPTRCARSSRAGRTTPSTRSTTPTIASPHPASAATPTRSRPPRARRRAGSRCGSCCTASRSDPTLADQRGERASGARRCSAYATACALGALELLAFAPRSAPTSPAALGIHTRTARRLPKKLVDEQYAIRLPADRYPLSARLLAPAAEAANRLPATTTHTPILRDPSAPSG